MCDSPILVIENGSKIRNLKLENYALRLNETIKAYYVNEDYQNLVKRN